MKQKKKSIKKTNNTKIIYKNTLKNINTKNNTISKNKTNSTKKTNKNNTNANVNANKRNQRNMTMKKKSQIDRVDKDSLSIISGFLTRNNKSKLARTGKNYTAKQTTEYLKKIKFNCKKMIFLKSIKIENLDRYFDEDVHSIDEDLLGFHRLKDVLSYNVELEDESEYDELERRLYVNVQNRKHEYDHDVISYMLLNAQTDETLQTDLLEREMKYLMRNIYVNLEGRTKYVIDIHDTSRKIINELRNKISSIDCEDKRFEQKYNDTMNMITELMKNKNVQIYTYKKNSKDTVVDIDYNQFSEEEVGNFEKMNIDKNEFINTFLTKNT